MAAFAPQQSKIECLKVASKQPLGGEGQIPWLCENALVNASILSDLILDKLSR